MLQSCNISQIDKFEFITQPHIAESDQTVFRQGLIVLLTVLPEEALAFR